MTDRSATTSLDGAVVAVFGHAPDGTSELARALADLGASVLVCPIWSPWFDPPYEEDLLALVEPATARPGQVHFLAGLDGRPFSDLLSEPAGVRRFVSWTRRAFGRLDAVVLGFHTVLGLTAGATFAAALRRTGGEVIAVEGDADSADQVVRTFAEPGHRGTQPIVMRAAVGRKRKPSDRLGPVARALAQASLLTEVTLADVDRAAAARRRRGDPIAGLRWQYVGGGDHDHGGHAIVTAQSLAAAGPLSDIDRVGWYRRHVTPLDELGVDGVILGDQNGIAGVEVVPSASEVVALRVGTLDDSFNTDEPYECGRRVASGPPRRRDRRPMGGPRRRRRPARTARRPAGLAHRHRHARRRAHGLPDVVGRGPGAGDWEVTARHDCNVPVIGSSRAPRGSCGGTAGGVRGRSCRRPFAARRRPRHRAS